VFLKRLRSFCCRHNTKLLYDDDDDNDDDNDDNDDLVRYVNSLKTNGKRWKTIYQESLAQNLHWQ
jgi:hypothetical protein